MIFFWGTLSVFQIIFLPGFVVLKYFKIKTDILSKIILCFFISLIINYLIVSISIYLNFYNKNFYIFLILLELLLIYLRFNLNSYSKIELNAKTKTIATFFVFILIFLAFYKNFGNVFFGWDALVSYNEWAKSISNSIYPGGMVRPLFISKIWSITYILTSNQEIHFFAKFLTAFFPCSILLLCLIDVINFGKTFDYLKLFFVLIFFYLNRNFILLGYADIPLLSFGFFLFYLCRRHRKFNIYFIYLVLILSLTIKISAIFFIPLVFYYTKNKSNKKIFFYFVSIIFIYIYILYYKKFSAHGASYFNSIFNEVGQLNNFNLIDKIKYAFMILELKKLHYLFILSIILSFVNKKNFFIFIFLVLPGWLYWALFLSYDIRNSFPSFLGIIIVNSFGLQYLCREILKNKTLKIQKFKKNKINKNFYSISIKHNLVFCFVFFLSLVIGLLINNDYIIKKDYVQKTKQIGDTEIKKELQLILNNNNNNIDPTKFITNYQPIFFSPQFKKLFNYQQNFVNDKIDINRNYELILIYGDHGLINFVKKIQKNDHKLKLYKQTGDFVFYILDKN